jgi:hypothetical protein
MFTREFLGGWWRRALRRRVLYTALDREDRGYLYLTMKALDRVRSADVGTIIVKILAKLKEALESPFVRKMETYGVGKARSISAKAVEWGHQVAESWSQDRGFVRYLTVLELNASTGWGI